MYFSQTDPIFAALACASCAFQERSACPPRATAQLVWSPAPVARNRWGRAEAKSSAAFLAICAEEAEKALETLSGFAAQLRARGLWAIQSNLVGYLSWKVSVDGKSFDWSTLLVTFYCGIISAKVLLENLYCRFFKKFGAEVLLGNLTLLLNL